MTKGARLLIGCAATLCLMPVSACSAETEPPPVFPDLGALPTVDEHQYFSSKVYRFATPDGVMCESAGYNPYFQWTCVGPAGAGSAQLDLSSYARRDGTPATVGTSQGGTDPAMYPVLPIKHQIRITAPVIYADGRKVTLVCGTPAPKTMACFVDDAVGTHGFVLSPERNWAF